MSHFPEKSKLIHIVANEQVSINEQLMLDMISSTLCTIEDAAEACGFSIQEAACLVTELELKGYIRKEAVGTLHVVNT